MPNEQLLAYIRNELARGVDGAGITQSLLTAGWKEIDISAAMNSVKPSPNQNVSTTPPPQKSKWPLIAGALFVLLLLTGAAFTFLYFNNPASLQPSLAPISVIPPPLPEPTTEGTPLTQGETSTNTPSGSSAEFALQDKMKKISDTLPAWAQAHPAQQKEASSLAQKMTDYANANDAVNAEKIADQILDLIGKKSESVASRPPTDKTPTPAAPAKVSTPPIATLVGPARGMSAATQDPISIIVSSGGNLVHAPATWEILETKPGVYNLQNVFLREFSV